MQPTVREALDAIRGVGSVDEMRQKAAAGVAPAARPVCNGHIHLPPNFSAFESVEHAVALAAEQKARVVGVTNYYDYRVYGDFATQARTRGIFPLFGLEIVSLDPALVESQTKVNDPGNPGRVYVCGKGVMGFGDLSEKAAGVLEFIKTSDADRMEKMTRRVAECFKKVGLDADLTADDVIEMIVRRHGSPRDSVYIQERHIAQAFQEWLFANVAAEARIARLGEVFGAASKADPEDFVKVQGEIRSHLMKAGRPAFVEERFVTYDDALALILEMGGIPCYPTLADGASPLSPYEDPVETLVANLRARNIHFAEFIPLRNRPDVLERYVIEMRAAGLVVTAGTEHNTLDLDPIEPACVGGAAVPETVKDIFWEGACVIAAHQFLTLHGECGFVDGAGNANPAYATADERIRAFAALGAAVIESYR